MDLDPEIQFLDWQPSPLWKGKNIQKNRTTSTFTQETKQEIHQNYNVSSQSPTSQIEDGPLEIEELDKDLSKLTFLEDVPQRVDHVMKNKKQMETCKQKQRVERTFFKYKIILQNTPFQGLSGDVLMIPFETANLQYHPGQQLKSLLHTQIQKIPSLNIINGGIYIKNNHQIRSFKYIVFLKIESKEVEKWVRMGLDSLIRKSNTSGLGILNINFYLCQQELAFQQVLEGVMNSKELQHIQYQLKVRFAVQDNFAKNSRILMNYSKH